MYRHEMDSQRPAYTRRTSKYEMTKDAQEKLKPERAAEQSLTDFSHIRLRAPESVNRPRKT